MLLLDLYVLNGKRSSLFLSLYDKERSYCREDMFKNFICKGTNALAYF
jgi:hypothetical protein